MSAMRRECDFGEFLKVLRREGRPKYLPFYEHIASPGFIGRRMGVEDPGRMRREDPAAYWRMYVNFWTGMGFDCVPMEIGLNCPLNRARPAGAVSCESEASAVIYSMEDFERYPWPSEREPIDFRPFELAAAHLPPGVKLVGGVGAGPYEWTTYMMGVVGLSMALYDQPELVKAVFGRIGSLHAAAFRQLATMPAIGALRQGDDLGFKTATFLAPDDLRALVFPIYRRFVEIAHGHGKPFILHSCGNLDAVYEDLIACGIDAKHSFEDVILPVADFKARYGRRITPLGGLDVDRICSGTPDQLRVYARAAIEACWGDGYWALGTGNSLTDYMPVENYLVVLEEGLRAGG